MGSCLGTCLASCFGSCMGKCLTSGHVKKDSTMRKMFAFLQLWNIVWLFMYRWLAPHVSKFPLFNHFFLFEFGIMECNKAGRDDLHGGNARSATAPGGPDQSKITACFQQQATERVFLSFAILFLILIFLSAIGATKIALNKFWGAKLLTPVFLPFLFAFLIPNDFFGLQSWLYYTCGGVSLFYLTAQMMILYDLGHSWNKTWVENALEAQREAIVNPNAFLGGGGNRNRDNNSHSNFFRQFLQSRPGILWYLGILLATIIFLTIAVLAVIYLPFVVYANEPNQYVILISHFLSVALLILSASDWCKNGAILPSALLVAYFAWLQWLMVLQRPGIVVNGPAAQQGRGSYLGGARQADEHPQHQEILSEPRGTMPPTSTSFLLPLSAQRRSYISNGVIRAFAADSVVLSPQEQHHAVSHQNDLLQSRIISYEYSDHVPMTADRYLSWWVGLTIMLVCFSLFLRNPSLLQLEDAETAEDRNFGARNGEEDLEQSDSSDEEQQATAVVGPEDGDDHTTGDLQDGDAGGREENTSNRRRRLITTGGPPKEETLYFLTIHAASAFYFRFLLYQRQDLVGYCILAVGLYANIVLFGWALVRPQIYPDE